jgi:NAD(P)-dependent dehydrogenase (short-subunit alcohol dehydrogenase family)
MPYFEHAHYTPVASSLSFLSAMRNGLGNFIIPILSAMELPVVDLHGKQAIVTGANSGIGFEAAKSLVAMGARVVLACRNQERAEQARRSILNAMDDRTQGNQVEVEVLDCASLDSVRHFVQRWGARSTTSINILINNAGK